MSVNSYSALYADSGTRETQSQLHVRMRRRERLKREDPLRLHAIVDETAFVEVAFTAPAVAVRDSEDPSGPHFAVDASAWQYFLTAVTRTG